MLERCLGFIDLRILIEYDLLYQLLLSWEMIPSYLPTSAYVVPLFISSDPRELYAADNGWLYNIYIYTVYCSNITKKMSMLQKSGNI